MTDDLVHKIEEKVIGLLDEMDKLRKETSQLKQENNFLKSERGAHAKKLQGLISLLDMVDVSVSHSTSVPNELEPA